MNFWTWCMTQLLKINIMKRIRSTYLINSRKAKWIKLDIRIPILDKKCIDYQILHSDDAVIRSSGISDIPCGHVVIMNNPILIDRQFIIIINALALNSPYFQCVIDHEVGHILDFVNRKFPIDRWFNLKRILGFSSVLKEEFSADEYSFRQNGNLMIEFIGFCISRYPRNAELDKRLNNLYSIKTQSLNR